MLEDTALLECLQIIQINFTCHFAICTTNITQIYHQLQNLIVGNNITVRCKVYLPNIDKNSIEAQVYYGQIMENGIVDKIQIIPMNLIGSDDEKKEYEYEATVELTTGGNYGYTFRVMPKNEMLLDPANLDLVKWITK